MGATTGTTAEGRVVAVNGTQLYYEIRGSGPSVLMISGATGDAGHYTAPAEILADEFTVVTYDRRGNSRSPAPACWTATSIDEQADDAAALVEALGLAPAAVFGNSGGAEILLSLLTRRPDVVRGAIIHEPPLVPVTSHPEATMTELMTMVQTAMSAGGPRGAMEAFIRTAAGDNVFESFDPELRERLLGNAELFFGLELQAMASFLPVPDAIKATRIEIEVAAGVENRGVYLYEASAWLAGQLGVPLREYPGRHVPYFDRPAEFADAIRPFLRRVS